MYFKAKDYVTAGNALCGLASTVVCIEAPAEDPSRYVFWASFLIVFGWLFDALDGVVARLTKTFNKFGSEFDNLCDHLTYGIAPAFIIYVHYRGWMPGDPVTARVLAAALAFVLPLTASIRGARFTVKPIKVPGFWIGLPRPVSAFIIVSYFNTALFGLTPLMEWAGIALVLSLGAMNLGGTAFLSHHGHVWKWYVGPILVLVAVSLGVTGLGGPILSIWGWNFLPPESFFDLMFFWLFGYMLMQWQGIPKAEWDNVRALVAAWRKAPDP